MERKACLSCTGETRESGWGLAEKLYTSNVESFHEPAGYPQTNELNVASVCASYAFELIYKVLVEVSGQLPRGVHSPSVAHERLGNQDRKEVERIINTHGWDVCEFLDYLDKLAHGNRKYWMRPRPPKTGPASGSVHIGGPSGFDELEKLHEELSSLAMKRINETKHEDWPGTASP